MMGFMASFLETLSFVGRCLGDNILYITMLLAYFKVGVFGDACFHHGGFNLVAADNRVTNIFVDLDSDSLSLPLLAKLGLDSLYPSPVISLDIWVRDAENTRQLGASVVLNTNSANFLSLYTYKLLAWALLRSSMGARNFKICPALN